MAEAKSRGAAEAKTAAPALTPAAESSDPAVHQLMAERYIAALNGDDEAAQAKTDALADLGYC